MVNDTIKELQVEADKLTAGDSQYANQTVNKQLDRLDDLAYRIKMAQYIIQYLGEWGDKVAHLHTPDDPDMNEGMKAYLEGYLKNNFARFVEILGQSTVDMVKAQDTILDVRQKIAEAWDDKGGGHNDSSQSKDASQ